MALKALAPRVRRIATGLLLVEAGADVTKKANGKTALELARDPVQDPAIAEFLAAAVSTDP